tara:strand:+ start:2675 stop:2905 length:231 start_codon:yes stop_codon:yes gene_type:complete
MNFGDLIVAKWSDGLTIKGFFLREERGYIILSKGIIKEVPCNKHDVQFSVLHHKDFRFIDKILFILTRFALKIKGL